MSSDATDSWDRDQYERFRQERSAPFYDLLALVRARPAMAIVDLGCGSGELTSELHQRLEAADTLGVDSSAKMLEGSHENIKPGLRFELGEIDEFNPGPVFDLVFSNAALQWLPDHSNLFARLTEALAKGGQLAIQMPANDDHPSHTIAREVAAEEPFGAPMNGYVRPQNVLPPEEYSRLLHGLGYREQHVRLQVYGHTLASRDEAVEWVRGTLLTDYQSRLPTDLFARFLERYRELLLSRLEDTKPYFYPFKRILLWATQ